MRKIMHSSRFIVKRWTNICPVPSTSRRQYSIRKMSLSHQRRRLPNKAVAAATMMTKKRRSLKRHFLKLLSLKNPTLSGQTSLVWKARKKA
jgi:hypothetical protein